MERRLGRGLSSLLGGAASGNPASHTETQQPTELPVDEIRPNPQQPRIRFDEAALEGLRDSIKLHGVIQAIAVRRTKVGYELISGERRLKAAKMAGRPSIPVVIHKDVSDDQALEWAMVENLQREDLDPIERAKGFQAMMSSLSLKQEQVAERVGLKRSTVTNHLRLLELPGEIQEALIQGLLSMGHARALAGLANADQQKELMGKTVRQGWSVRQLERKVRTLSSREQVRPAVAGGPDQGQKASWIQDVEGRMRESLGTQVVVNHRADGGGKVSISYHDTEELNRVLDRLAPRRLI